MKTRKHRHQCPTYRWSGITNTKRKMHGEIQASTPAMAKILLQQQGITPLTVRKKISLFPQKHNLSPLDITIFYRQLATLIKAGIPLIQSLRILSQNPKQFTLRQLLQSLINDLESGKKLAHSLKKHPQCFDPITCHLIHLAEYSGTLDSILIRIAHHNEKSLLLKNKFKQALLYPAIITCVSLLISLIMLFFVIPRFDELFQSFHRPLPAFTLAVIHLSHFLRHYAWGCLLPIGFGFIFNYYRKKSFHLKHYIDTLSFKIPITGHLFKKTLLAHFARTLSTTLAAGLPITDSLNQMTDLSHNLTFRFAIKKVLYEISAGQRLYQAMLLNPLFPADMTQMVKVGEESGTLDPMLEKIAEFYEAEIEHWTNNFSQLLEPLIIIVLGVLIGGLVVAMYLPIFKLGAVI
jgi:type IV pilus assembly protein PilC